MAPKQPERTELELDPKYDHYDFPTVSVEAREGHPGYLTPAQQAQVHQLRMTLESEGFDGPLDTLTLLRFLRARKFDVNAAKNMLVESQKWRSAMTIVEQEGPESGKPRLLSLKDDPMNNPPDEPLKLNDAVRTWDKDGTFKRGLAQYYPQFYHKTDKDGRLLYFEKLGGIDFGGLKKNAKATNDRMIYNLAVEYEKMVDPRLPACSRQAGHLVETSCSILDFAGVSLLSPGAIYNYIKQASAMSGNNYPERMGKMYVINVHWSQQWIFSIIKGFLDPVTAAKIDHLGKNYLPELLKQVPAENLPASYGGKCQCPGGCELSDAGPWQEEEWRRPAWWEKDPAETTIENKPTEIEAGNGVPIAAETQVEGQPTEAEGAGATNTEVPVTEEAKVPA
ncbi:hypothetical protein NPX13_g5183 [Xylaria arbuscula]|uniref:CRAL-TRIO domain-containing protein n=1 Tax=Xylaria arbuscula TaxID=114810 RepID=A0A9W8NEZ0_9PEZI|nr:hypothetical protein NPX13_g5183 [Xylaria arbuscula]